MQNNLFILGVVVLKQVNEIGIDKTFCDTDYVTNSHAILIGVKLWVLLTTATLSQRGDMNLINCIVERS